MQSVIITQTTRIKEVPGIGELSAEQRIEQINQILDDLRQSFDSHMQA